MLLRRRPSEAEIRAFIATQAQRRFSYDEPGMTRGAPPGRYTVDSNRVLIGRGEATFERAVSALRAWRMFAIDGVELCWPNAPIEVGTTVAVLAAVGALWSLNACRIVYLIDERGPLTRWGFAYGTLPAHIVRGEERFCVEWTKDSDEVIYDLFAASRPRSALLACVRPLLRKAQRRFARRSLEAMRRAIC
jgi:uncharacterized protein (UPF0548 family)